MGVQHNNSKNNYLNYINNFRGLAILYIVVIHAISAFNWKNSEDTRKLLNIFLNNGSVLFVFISGYLFQHLSGKYDFKTYFSKKLKFVILPYIISSTPAIIYFVWFGKRWDVPIWFYEQSKPIQIVVFYLTGWQLAPYWFIPMIFLFYLISPILVRLDNNRIIYWFLPLFCAVSLVVNRSAYPYINFVHYFSVYLLGMCFSRYKRETMKFMATNGYIIASLAIVCILYFLSYRGLFTISGYLEKLVLCTFYLSLFYKYDAFVKNLFSGMAALSFGMYFLHSYYISTIKLLAKNFYGGYFSGSLPSYILFTLFIIVISALSVMGIKKVSGRYSRYLIGS